MPHNPLDVLAQQVVSMVALDEWPVDEVLALVRRAYPYRALPQSAFDAVLDMLSGRYPSDEFAELRPRLVWDRVAGTLSGRPGAQRLAVTSGGTIPDRGLFGVYLVGSDRGARVGELDEEMVYESRVGDVFALGATSWRIEDITHDRVLVSPAPGVPGKMPFWHGDSLGRPAELGAALGAFVREIGRVESPAAVSRLRAAGLDAFAATNLVAYVAEQRTATGHVPDDRTVVVERFRDELGDWRLVVHSPYGAAVHAPWALAVGARLRERYGVDVQAAHSDDGMVFRIPDTWSGGDDVPGADVVVIDPEEVEDLVTTEVGGSALFAARFRECAARALLLPRRDPQRRTPLWQQRQRSAQLLSVASRYGSFPVVLETMRECLQDVYDLPALVGLMRSVAGRTVRVVEVETTQPSPFARSLLFGYVAAFMYEGDAPLAERRAQALALDSSVLAELLGRAELRELLDADVVERTERELQRLVPDRRARDVEAVADLLRVLGPLSLAEVAERSAVAGSALDHLDALTTARRAIVVRVAGRPCWAAVEDAGRLRDALGVPPPVGVPDAFLEPVVDPLGDLLSRHARTHGPFDAASVTERFGLGVAVVVDALRRLAAAGRVVEGEFRPGGSGSEWCDAEVLRMLRRRSLAALRQEVEPVEPTALGRFLPSWQHVGGALRGVAGLLRAVEQLAGCPVPASALERLVLPARVAGYTAAWLDELTASGEVLWAGHGALPGSDGWVSLHLADTATLTVPAPGEEGGGVGGPLHEAVLAALAPGGAYFFRGLADTIGATDDAALVDALWELVWAGRIGNDTLAPLRAWTAGGRTAHRAARPGPLPGRTRYGGRARPALPARTGPPAAAGRWSRLPAGSRTRRAERTPPPRRCSTGTASSPAARCRPSGCRAGSPPSYRVLTAFEEPGRARRGYFVDGPRRRPVRAAGRGRPAARRRRSSPRRRTAGPRRHRPGQPVRRGAALAGSVATRRRATGPGRKAGALVVLVDGDARCCTSSVAAGPCCPSPTTPRRSARPPTRSALAVRDGALGRLSVERADGEAVLGSAMADVLAQAGFAVTPRGLRLRG